MGEIKKPPAAIALPPSDQDGVQRQNDGKAAPEHPLLKEFVPQSEYPDPEATTNVLRDILALPVDRKDLEEMIGSGDPTRSALATNRLQQSMKQAVSASVIHHFTKGGATGVQVSTPSALESLALQSTMADVAQADALSSEDAIGTRLAKHIRHGFSILFRRIKPTDEPKAEAYLREKAETSAFAAVIEPSFFDLREFVTDMFPDIRIDGYSFRLAFVEVTFKLLAAPRAIFTRSTEEFVSHLEKNVFPERIDSDEILNSSGLGGFHGAKDLPESTRWALRESDRSKSLEVAAVIQSLIHILQADPLHRNYFSAEREKPVLRNQIAIPILYKHQFFQLIVDLSQPPNLDQIASSLAILDDQRDPEENQADGVTIKKQWTRAALRVSTYREPSDQRAKWMKTVLGDKYATVPFNIAIYDESQDDSGRGQNLDLFQSMVAPDSVGNLNGNDQSPVGVALGFSSDGHLKSIGCANAHKSIYGLDDADLGSMLAVHVGQLADDNLSVKKEGNLPIVQPIHDVDREDFTNAERAWMEGCERLNLSPLQTEFYGSFDVEPELYEEINHHVSSVVKKGTKFGVTTACVYSHMLTFGGSLSHTIISKANDLLISAASMMDQSYEGEGRNFRLILRNLINSTTDVSELIAALSDPNTKPAQVAVSNLVPIASDVQAALLSSIDIHRRQNKTGRMIMMFSYFSGLLENFLNKVARDGLNLRVHAKALTSPDGMVSSMMVGKKNSDILPPSFNQALTTARTYIDSLGSQDLLKARPFPDTLKQQLVGKKKFATAFSKPYFPDISKLKLSDILTNPYLSFSPITGATDWVDTRFEVGGTVTQRYTFDHLTPDIIRKMNSERSRFFTTTDEAEITRQLEGILTICKALSINVQSTTDRGKSAFYSIPELLSNHFPGREAEIIKAITGLAQEIVDDRAATMKKWMQFLPAFLSMEFPKRKSTDEQAARTTLVSVNETIHTALAPTSPTSA